ncbi:MAG: GDP-mannose 4,6-dehydratase [Deltaproteobacteria bacterium]|nr:GDP-mannose 4,6-dehydratase [Deltaproteobacteria bacterium]
MAFTNIKNQDSLTYLIAGGAGFIGSHLCETLLENGHSVIALDNLVTGSQNNIEHLAHDARFTFIEHDIKNPIPTMGKIDCILNMASPASPMDFENLSIEIMLAGSIGTYHLLEFAKEKNAWFMMASTSEVYGDPEVHPQKEDYLGNVNCIGVRSVYDESKRFSESMTNAYLRKNLVQTSIIRIFNTYGPRMRVNDGRVVPNFIDQALHHKPITIHGKGTQTRSFCFVDDLVRGIIRTSVVRPETPINLGNTTEKTILEVAENIIAFTNSKSELTFLDLPEGDPKRRCPVLTRAKEILDWEPEISFADGIKKTIEYFKNAP